LQYDVVGFQTDGDSENFVRYLIAENRDSRREMQMFETSAHQFNLRLNGQQTRIGTFPVGIEARGFQMLARQNARSLVVKELVASLGGRALVIGVDRLDYSKGLIQRLEAFEIFLARNQDWQGNVTYLQIAPKNRSEIPEYSDLAQAVGSVAGRINGKYGEVSWTPIRYINRVYSRSVLAGLYRAARVGLVTPLRDGMNLVAKEYVAAQDPNDPGVLILSRFAGAAVDGKRALLVNPYDAESVAGAITQALVMPLAERRERHAALLHGILENNVNKWQKDFLDVLRGDDPTGKEIRVAMLDGTGRPGSPGSVTGTGVAARGMDPAAAARV
jgi:trehalose 6-phosphate synthase